MSGIERDKFDEMIVDIDSRLFDVQVLISRFVVEMMEEWPEHRVDIEITIPVISGDAVVLHRVVNAVLGTDGGSSLVFMETDGQKLTWEEMDVASQYIIANRLHGVYVTKKIGDRFRSSGQ